MNIRQYDRRKIKKLKRKKLLFSTHASFHVVVVGLGLFDFKYVLRLEQSILDAIPKDTILCQPILIKGIDISDIEVDYEKSGRGGIRIQCYLHFKSVQEFMKFRLKI